MSRRHRGQVPQASPPTVVRDPILDAALAPLLRHLGGRPTAILTAGSHVPPEAEQPSPEPNCTPAGNEERNRNLAMHLHRMGYGFIHTLRLATDPGGEGGEPCYTVPGMPFHDALALARAYAHGTFVWSDGDPIDDGTGEEIAAGREYRTEDGEPCGIISASRFRVYVPHDDIWDVSRGSCPKHRQRKPGETLPPAGEPGAEGEPLPSTEMPSARNVGQEGLGDALMNLVFGLGPEAIAEHKAALRTSFPEYLRQRLILEHLALLWFDPDKFPPSALARHGLAPMAIGHIVGKFFLFLARNGGVDCLQNVNDFFAWVGRLYVPPTRSPGVNAGS